MVNFDKNMYRNLSNVVGSIFQPLIHYNTFSHNVYIVSKIVKKYTFRNLYGIVQVEVKSEDEMEEC